MTQFTNPAIFNTNIVLPELYYYSLLTSDSGYAITIVINKFYMSLWASVEPRQVKHDQAVVAVATFQMRGKSV